MPHLKPMDLVPLKHVAGRRAERVDEGKALEHGAVRPILGQDVAASGELGRGHGEAIEPLTAGILANEPRQFGVIWIDRARSPGPERLDLILDVTSAERPGSFL